MPATQHDDMRRSHGPGDVCSARLRAGCQLAAREDRRRLGEGCFAAEIEVRAARQLAQDFFRPSPVPKGPERHDPDEVGAEEPGKSRSVAGEMADREACAREEREGGCRVEAFTVKPLL